MRCSVGGIVLTLLVVAGCATSTATSHSDVELRIEQLPDAGFAVEDRGAMSVAYQATVRNRSAETLTLRKIEMQTSGRSPYSLRDEPVTLNETIEPGKEAVVNFTMWSISKGKRTSAHEMVWVTGAAYFESGKGTLRQTFTQFFREP